MPRKLRRRLTTPSKKKISNSTRFDIEAEDYNEWTPRGRLKGALKTAMEPAGAEESDGSVDKTPTSKSRRRSSTSSEDNYFNRRQSPQRYVLKLFDRSVDLSQFSEDSPLYPICRAWIANKPKMNYKKFGKKKYRPEPLPDSVELPGPSGPPVSCIPKLLPEQENRSKDNINLDYTEEEAPSREELLNSHRRQWARVRQAWLAQGLKAEARYNAAQEVLNKISLNAL